MKIGIFDDLCDTLKKLDVLFTMYSQYMNLDEKEVFERLIRFYVKLVQENVVFMQERVEERINYVRDS